ncbi:MAG: hypothetical protein SWQ30_15025 [Thermodesulfobacteriota bacterium]|nr:hypothetical protein [Thermodesulfobacteriota bacterium]
MNLKMAIVALVAIGLMVLSGLAMASPPVPPPVESFNIATNVDGEMSGDDWSKIGQFTYTWVQDIENIDPSTLAHPGVPQRMCSPGDPRVCKSYGNVIGIPPRNTGIRRTFGDFLDETEEDDIGRIREEIFAPLTPPPYYPEESIDYTEDPQCLLLPPDACLVYKPGTPRGRRCAQDCLMFNPYDPRVP